MHLGIRVLFFEEAVFQPFYCRNNPKAVSSCDGHPCPSTRSNGSISEGVADEIGTTAYRHCKNRGPSYSTHWVDMDTRMHLGIRVLFFEEAVFQPFYCRNNPKAVSSCDGHPCPSTRFPYRASSTFVASHVAPPEAIVNPRSAVGPSPCRSPWQCLSPGCYRHKQGCNCMRCMQGIGACCLTGGFAEVLRTWSLRGSLCTLLLRSLTRWRPFRHRG
jgi:hypothetical protein